MLIAGSIERRIYDAVWNLPGVSKLTRQELEDLLEEVVEMILEEMEDA